MSPNKDSTFLSLLVHICTKGIIVVFLPVLEKMVGSVCISAPEEGYVHARWGTLGFSSSSSPSSLNGVSLSPISWSRAFPSFKSQCRSHHTQPALSDHSGEPAFTWSSLALCASHALAVQPSYIVIATFFFCTPYFCNYITTTYS